MSTFKLLGSVFRFFYTAYIFLHRNFTVLKLGIAKQRSERALQKLDDHLLNDIGLKREGDDFVPLKVKAINNTRLYRFQEHQLRRQIRSHRRVRARESHIGKRRRE